LTFAHDYGHDKHEREYGENVNDNDGSGVCRVSAGGRRMAICTVKLRWTRHTFHCHPKGI
jgi:hypothetical protein